MAANCPEFDVKQRILAYEYEELIGRPWTGAGCAHDPKDSIDIHRVYFSGLAQAMEKAS